MLDIVTHHETDLPDLNQARFLHSSIVLGVILFVFGGRINASQESSGTIECLNLQSMQAWITLLDSSKHVERSESAIAAVSPT